MRLFLERFFRLIEPRIGYEAIQKLDLLVNIWLEGKVDRETRKKKTSSGGKLFALSDIGEDQNCLDQMDDSVPSLPWQQDQRGEEFWRSVPLGGSL